MQTDLFGLDAQKNNLNKLELPPCVQYWADFISDEQATNLYQLLIEKVDWQQPEIFVYGKMHKIPRKQAWFADDNIEYTYSEHKMQATPWLPEFLFVKQNVEQLTGFKFNSLLLNWYRDGNDKMGAHADDEPELGANPAVVTVSLGAERDFVFKHNQSDKSHSVLLHSGSLLLMKPGMQSSYKHHVPARKKVTEGRISLTFRYIY